MAGSPFEIQQLRGFIAVAEELNFRRAAERLNMTQPPLSRQIRQLEHLLSVTLFERTNRSVRLTAAGQSFLYDAVDILKRSEAAKLSAMQAARGEAGAIAIGFVPSAAAIFVPTLVASLAKSAPAVKLQLLEMMSYEQTEALRSGKLDLGISRLFRGNHTKDIRHIVSEDFVLACPKDHPLTREPVLSIQNLDRVDYISYSVERGGFLAQKLGGLFSLAGVSPNVRQTVSQGYSVIGLVNAGVGVALVPRSTTALKMDNVTYREIALPTKLRSDLYLAVGTNRQSKLNDRVALLIVKALAAYTPQDNETKFAET